MVLQSCFSLANLFRDNYGTPYDESGAFCRFLCGHEPTSGNNCRNVLLTFRRRRVVSACYSRRSLFPGNYKLECDFFSLSFFFFFFFFFCVSEERLVKCKAASLRSLAGSASRRSVSIPE